jgi:hypothetical protein
VESVKDVRTESFDFLGYALGPKHAPRGGQKYLGASPSRKSVQCIKDKIGALLTRRSKGSWLQIRGKLNHLLAGCRRISAMAPALARIGPSMPMSAIASGASSPSGTRSLDRERARFPGAASSENSG